VTNKARILFVDDNQAARDLFVQSINTESFEPSVASSVVEAERAIAGQMPDVVITDLRMPEIDGLEGMKRFHRIAPDVPIIVITAFGTVETAVESMKLGAFDYLRKPFKPSEIELVIMRALKHRHLLQENTRLRSEVTRQFSEGSIIASSKSMRAAMDLARRAASSEFPVLISGESGTGKDVLARHIHYSGKRSSKSFVAINCSAIPENLLESELFGHEKGAFSGAEKTQQGFFVKADKGTLFLDEIGDMSINLQPKLLRVLQDGSFYPVGGRTLVRTDARLICATNQNINKLLESGQFRQDLFYRINTIKIALPPLRERQEDIVLLAEHFLARLRESGHTVAERFSSEAIAMLKSYRWPGNVRELEHAVERITLSCDCSTVSVVHLPTEISGLNSSEHVRIAPGITTEAPVHSYREAREDFERSYFHQVLAAANDNMNQAANLAGLHRSSLYEKLIRLKIRVGAK